jgi:HEPN domain-containing protein
VRKEVEHWWLQALKDLDSAYKNLNFEREDILITGSFGFRESYESIKM